MKTNPNDPAFGHAHVNVETGGFDYTEDGLTKREYFAALALQGILASPVRAPDHKAAALAVTLADDLLEALR
jgi:hypothetical protein